MSNLPSTLIPEVPTAAASAVNDKFCKEHPGLCSPSATAGSKLKNVFSSLFTDADPEKAKQKKNIAYGVGAVLIGAVAIGVGYHLYKKYGHKTL